ncbi:MAG: adenylyltransferase/cytidyltransferase family protein [Verrucomicrobiota bacterium]
MNTFLIVKALDFFQRLPMGEIIPFDQLIEWRSNLNSDRSPLVVTNGCFDLLHVGHVRYLQQASELGKSLLIGINDDAGVQKLKGPSRPLNCEGDRAEILSALACITAVSIFSGDRAVEFLDAARPDIYVKGGDYTVDDLYPPERAILEKHASKIKILPFSPGRSTTNLIERMKS